MTSCIITNGPLIKSQEGHWYYARHITYSKLAHYDPAYLAGINYSLIFYTHDGAVVVADFEDEEKAVEAYKEFVTWWVEAVS